jgi:hypothetical protein
MFSDRTNWPLTHNPFTIALDELRASGVPLLDLIVSNPTQCGFHYDSTAILSAFQNPAALNYDPQPKGTLAARREVARYYLDDYQTTIDPNPSSSPAAPARPTPTLSASSAIPATNSSSPNPATRFSNSWPAFKTSASSTTLSPTLTAGSSISNLSNAPSRRAAAPSF